jgi:hypothetical protein
MAVWAAEPVAPEPVTVVGSYRLFDSPDPAGRG